jgi:type IV pilus assembly protein PilE
MRRQSGVTLIELLIVTVVVAILGSLALASYRNQVMRTHRTDATAALMKVAAAQEKFFLQNNRYATEAERATAPPAGLGIAGTESGYYVLAIADADGVVATPDFRVTATPAAGRGQEDDDDCASFSLDHEGLRRAQDAGSNDNTATCWR